MTRPNGSHARSHGHHDSVPSGASLQVRRKLSRATSTLAPSHGISRKTQTRRSGSHGHRTADLTLSLPLKGEGGSATHARPPKSNPSGLVLAGSA